MDKLRSLRATGEKAHNDMNKPDDQHLVVALAYDRMGTFEFGCTTEVFALSRPEIDGPWYRFAVCAVEPGPLRATGGIRVDAPHALDMLDTADTIVVPGWRDPDEPPPEALLARLRAAHERGARVCSICSGAFVLGWAGLLDGRRATTHWRLTARLQDLFPNVQIEPDALYVDEGRILTSAGSAAGLDMLLHLVARDRGGKVANQVAQRLVMPPHRHGGQAQIVSRPVPPDEQRRLSALMDWMRAHLHEPHTLDSMASQAAMSKRTLQRQFLDATGLSPYEWLIRERVVLARQFLEAPHSPLSSVGERTGFGSEQSFRRHFRRIAGLSPSDYRRALREDLAERAQTTPA